MFASALAISPSDSIATTVNRAGAIITTGDDGTVGSITLALRLRAIVPCSALSLWIFVDKKNKWSSDKNPTANYSQKTERVGTIRMLIASLAFIGYAVVFLLQISQGADLSWAWKR